MGKEMVFIDGTGLKYYTLSIFRLGKDKVTEQEEALALMLVQNQRGNYQFNIDRFIIPDNFPETETYEWQEIDVSLVPRLSEIRDYPGFYYPAKDFETLREKFDI